MAKDLTSEEKECVAMPNWSDTLRAASPGDTITRVDGRKFHVIGLSDNHVWVRDQNSVIPGVFCGICLMMRSKRGNKPCRGASPLRM